ncbi:hypothetical protein, partial [Xenorhabdus bovienii]|uniref:hypothetical protein n=1 Tax=Xenorhabdus bovienii TaxID=40576 RepID=UPI003DA5C474
VLNIHYENKYRNPLLNNQKNGIYPQSKQNHLSSKMIIKNNIKNINTSDIFIILMIFIKHFST